LFVVSFLKKKIIIIKNCNVQRFMCREIERDASPTQGHTPTLARDPPNSTKRKWKRTWVTNFSTAHFESIMGYSDV
jgi:hypothetical protein